LDVVAIFKHNPFRLSIFLALAGLSFAPAKAAEQNKALPKVFGYYCAELGEDREWSLRFTGNVPEGSEVTVVITDAIIYDAKAKFLKRFPVPPGTYTEDKPFVVTMPKDGWTGYNKLLILGCDDPEFLHPRCSIPLRDEWKTPQLKGQSYYFREPDDREWHLTFVGEVPEYPGGYIVLHDAASRLVYHGELPRGTYTVEKPFVVTVPKDGITGDYRLVLLVSEGVVLGLRRPLSDLPFEEVGGHYAFRMGSPWPVPVFFRAPADTTSMAMAGYKAYVRVFNMKGEIIADGRVDGRTLEQMDEAQRKRMGDSFGKYDIISEFPVEPGQLYVLDSNAAVNTFPDSEERYLALDPAKLFVPDSKLTAVKWWQLVRAGQ
jgi:hypothetical protein